MHGTEVSGSGRRRVDATLSHLRGHAVTVGDVAGVVVVTGLSLWLPRSSGLLVLPAVAGAALAAAVSRRTPAWALGLVWAVGVLQLLTSTAVFGLQAAAVLVAYRTAAATGLLTLAASYAPIRDSRRQPPIRAFLNG